jgi:hypothetical protein
MEKYGVECSCAKDRPPQHLEKLASGDQRCAKCGRTYGVVKVSETLKMTDAPKVQQPK